jgi:hypothetical protein
MQPSSCRPTRGKLPTQVEGKKNDAGNFIIHNYFMVQEDQDCVAQLNMPKTLTQKISYISYKSHKFQFFFSFSPGSG